VSLAPFLTVEEVAAQLGVSTKTIRRRLKDGTIRRAPLGGRAVRIPASEIARLAGAAFYLEEETSSEFNVLAGCYEGIPK
jgi:excisionase family DNA binding protein